MGYLSEFDRAFGRIAEFHQPEAVQRMRDNTPMAFDSRFGLRVLPKSDEKPSIFTYSNPGRSVGGEHLT